MVPLFTAPDSDKAKTPGSFNRLSDQAAHQEDQLARPAQKRSSMAMYGILGGVLLAAGLGIHFYLDRQPDDSQFNKPFDIPLVTSDEDDANPTGEIDTPPAADDPLDARATVLRLVDRMIQSAQMSVNRDKALCRRLTADALLRVGKEERAGKELDQLLVVSRQRNLSNEYYRIKPLVRVYWKAIGQNDQTAADALFATMEPDARTIPETGLLAIEAAVSWGAVLVQRNQGETAYDLVERLKIDDSVRLRVDGLYSSVWSAITVSAAEVGQRSDSPITAHIWANPVATAVAVELSLHNQWESAISWAELWKDPFEKNDLLTEICRQAIRLQAAPSVIDRVTEAAANTPSGQRRIQAVLAQLSDDRLQSAVANMQTVTATVADEMPALGDVLRYQKPELTADFENARVWMELARSAAERKQTDIAAAAIVSLFDFLGTALPPTAAVRLASKELDHSAKALKTRLRKHLGMSESASIHSDFNNYRRGLDRLATAVEMRRLFLIRLLCGVVEIDGGSSLNQALDLSEPLGDELKLDPLCQLIAGEAVLAGGSVPQLAEVAVFLIPRGRRTDAEAEDSVAPIWLSTVQAAEKTYETALFRDFESTFDVAGLRSCLQRRIAESQANKEEVKILSAAAAIKSETCREDSLWTAAAWLVRGGHHAEVEAWAIDGRLSATERALTMSGIVSGLELPALSPEQDE